jgi:hypothetical protein
MKLPPDHLARLLSLRGDFRRTSREILGLCMAGAGAVLVGALGLGSVYRNTVMYGGPNAVLLGLFVGLILGGIFISTRSAVWYRLDQGSMTAFTGHRPVWREERLAEILRIDSVSLGATTLFLRWRDHKRTVYCSESLIRALTNVR